MHFTGTVYFDFGSYDVWRLHTVLAKASQDRGVNVEVEWHAFTAEDLDSGLDAVRGLAACEAVRAVFPQQHERFVRSLLTLAYQERDNPGSNTSLSVAAKVAGIEPSQAISAADESGMELLAASVESARERGVGDVPTIERQGPPLPIKTNDAANYGNAVARLRLIDHIMRDDGIWAMSKPS